MVTIEQRNVKESPTAHMTNKEFLESLRLYE
jgi:hypothetical protein